MRHLLTLNICLVIPLLGNSTNGYDGSLLNGLQSLPQWRDDFNSPKGLHLGALSNAYVFGNILGFVSAAWFSDRFGRLWGIRIGAAVICVGAAIQAAAQSYAMFFVARLIIGVGGVCLIVAGSCLVSELAYPTHRTVVTALFGPSWYAGATLAAWISYGTSFMDESNSLAWRLPSALQAVLPFMQLIGTFFRPESPRYLVDASREDDAKKVLMKYHGGDDPANSLLVDMELNEFRTAIVHDKTVQEVGWRSFLRTKANRRRLFIVMWLAMTQQLCGNGLVSYYLNLILNSIGITSAKEQLVINGGLMIYNVGTAVISGFIVGSIRRRPTFVIGLGTMLAIFTIWTALSAVNEERNFEQKSLGQSVLAMIFLFYATYNLCLNALPNLYISEVLPYHLRSKGTTTFALVGAVTNVYNGFVNPIAMGAISWRYYIVFCGLLLVELIVFTFVFSETYGYTLEEAAAAFGDGALVQNSHSGKTEDVEVSHIEK